MLQNILNKLNLTEAELSSINGASVDVSKLTAIEKLTLAKAIADAQGLKVTEKGVENASGDKVEKQEIVGETPFKSVYNRGCKFFGTPSDKQSGKKHSQEYLAQAVLCLIPQVDHVEMDAVKWDTPIVVYKTPVDDKDNVFDAKTSENLGWSKDKILATLEVGVIRGEYNANPEKLLASLQLEWAGIKMSLEEYILSAVQPHLAKKANFVVKMNKKTGRVVLLKDHYTKYSTPFAL